MASNRYFYDDGESRKFWESTLRGKRQTIRYGRLGTKGRESTKTFASPAEAKAATANLIKQKIAKGYVRVDPGLLKIARPKGKRAATEAQVAKFEKRLGANLPADYRRFLLTKNGGEPEPNEVNLPLYGERNSRPVGFLYGLYPKPTPYESLWDAVENTMTFLPAGQLPVAGQFNLYYYSISFDRNPGCIYFWNEDLGGYDVDKVGNPIFDDSHAVLVAGSFDEFLTRIAVFESTEEEPEEDAVSEPYVPHIPELDCGKRLSKRRRKEILRLTEEGGEELSSVFAQAEEMMRNRKRKAGDALVDKFLRKMDREIKQFLKTTTDKLELQYFAENWHWDANTQPLMHLVKHPDLDAGTLLQLFWYGCPEDTYLFYASASDAREGYDRYTFQVMRHAERRIVNKDYKTASIPFDPAKFARMQGKQEDFARRIPDVMYQPVGVKKKRG